MSDHDVEKQMLTDPVFLAAFIVNDLIGHFGGHRSEIQHSIGAPAVVVYGVDREHQVSIRIERIKP